MKVLFIAPTSTKLDLSQDLAAVSNGNEIEECANGLIDRSAVERLLRHSAAEILYIGTDGKRGILQLNGGEVIDENDLVVMMKPMVSKLKCVFLNACNSEGIGTAIHNAYHLPVICCEAPVGDAPAIQMARSFFSAMRSNSPIKPSFDSAKATVTTLYPNDGPVIRLLNGDMATNSQLDECMTFVRGAIGEMRVQLDGIEADVKELKGAQPKMIMIGLALLTLLLFAQIATPFLNAAVGR